MDWGLFDKNAGENTFLREEIVYPQKVCTKSACIYLKRKKKKTNTKTEHSGVLQYIPNTSLLKENNYKKMLIHSGSKNVPDVN